MKRIPAITSLIILFSSLSLQAAPVSKDKAMDVASKIFAAQSTRKAGNSALKMVWDGEDIATKAAQPAFYVIARESGGFVIIAGDDNVPPVLAISEANDFTVEDMPDNVKWWMERMKAYVRSTTSQSPEARDQWAKFAGTKAGGAITGTVENRVEHLTPEWGQDVIYHKGKADERKIFNSKCPLDSANRYTAAGCVAVAIGEVMTTLSGLYSSDIMPTHSSGIIEPYSVSSGSVSASTAEHPYVLDAEYEWDNLRKLTGKSAIISALVDGNADWVDNMDQLLADVGAMMHSFYGYQNTSAYTNRIPDTIGKYLGFNKGAYYESASNFSRHQWRVKLKEQLAERPIIYNGRTEDNKAGHAFVFDGYGQYEGADVFHVNFGWIGNCNGYYYETNLDSDGTPEFNFSWKCGAIFDFYPDPTSTYPILLEAHYTNATFCGVKAGPNAQNPEQFDISYNICNNGKTTYNGKIKIAVRKKNGEVYDIVSSRDFSVEPNRYSGASSGPYSITGISFGDQVVCFYKEDLTKEDSDASAWKLLPGPIATAISAWPLTPAAFIKTESSYSLNDWFVFELMNNDYIYPETRWTITDPDGVPTIYSQSDKEFQLTKTGKYKIEAAVIQKVGGTVIENLVTIINVGSGNSQ